MQFIKNYFIAKKICKKYGIDLSVMFTSYGSLTHRIFLGRPQATIHINIFKEDFLPILLHEVGHFVDYYKIGTKDYRGTKCRNNLKYSVKNIPKLTEDWTIGGEDYWEVLQAEATASKFANRVLKGRNQDKLLGYFKSYIQCGLKIIPSEKLEEFLCLTINLENRIKYKNSSKS